MPSPRTRPAATLLGALAVLALLLALVPAPAAAQPGDTATPARAAGPTRYHTAAEIARFTFDDAAVAHLVAGEGFADALAASFGAGAVGGPILLVPPTPMGDDHPTLQALRDLGIRRVVLVGGVNAVSPAAEAQLAAAGYDVERISGVDRYQTASAVAMYYGTRAGVGLLEGDRTALIASGETFADALAAGPVAAGAGLPLFLTAQARTDTSVNTSLRQLGVERVVIVGGQNAVSSQVVEDHRAEGYAVERWSGSARTETAAVIADNARQRLGMDSDLVLLARGDGFADALAASVHGGVRRAPILLSQSPDLLSDPTRDWLRSACGTIRAVRAIGGTAAVTDGILRDAVVAAGWCQPALPARCTNPTDGYAVSHPETWATNTTTVDEVPPCSMFDSDRTLLQPDGNQVPPNLGAYLLVDEVAFADAIGPDPDEAVLQRRTTTVDGRPAERIEVRATSDNPFPAGTLTTRWAVDLGDGTTFIAVTRSMGQSPYGEKVAVIDGMVRSLDLDAG